LTLRLNGFENDGEMKAAAARRGIKIKCVTDYLVAPCGGYGGVAVINYSSAERSALDKITVRE
ncbi:MAG: hypothetical protein K2L72_05640, partial [Clostridia bacterium]|nr:hypothetical protein [Clostridia bacterium]